MSVYITLMRVISRDLYVSNEENQTAVCAAISNTRSTDVTAQTSTTWSAIAIKDTTHQ